MLSKLSPMMNPQRNPRVAARLYTRHHITYSACPRAWSSNPSSLLSSMLSGQAWLPPLLDARTGRQHLRDADLTVWRADVLAMRAMDVYKGASFRASSSHPNQTYFSIYPRLSPICKAQTSSPSSPVIMSMFLGTMLLAVDDP